MITTDLKIVMRTANVWLSSPKTRRNDSNVTQGSIPPIHIQTKIGREKQRI